MEYFDLGVGVKSIVDILNSGEFQWKGEENIHQWKASEQMSKAKRTYVSEQLYQVRPSAVCVVGKNSRAVLRIKESLAQIDGAPLAIESFHVRKSDDIRDGAMLVPKIILVATHCPGRKVLDDAGEEGQLDTLYDEAYESGAEVAIIYMDLPQALYPPLQHGLYHDNVTRLLFPSQPLLRFLALSHSFFTVSEYSDLNSMQKEVLLDWINTPVSRDHPVYSRAQSLAAEVISDSERIWAAQDATYNRERRATEPYLIDSSFIPASEEHPLVDSRRFTPLTRRRIGDVFGSGRYVFRDAISRRNYGTLVEPDEDRMGTGGGLPRSLSTDDKLGLMPLSDEQHQIEDDDEEIYNENSQFSYQRQLIRTDYV